MVLGNPIQTLDEARYASLLRPMTGPGSCNASKDQMCIVGGW